jgi:hypothetical protein
MSKNNGKASAYTLEILSPGKGRPVIHLVVKDEAVGTYPCNLSDAAAREKAAAAMLCDLKKHKIEATVEGLADELGKFWLGRVNAQRQARAEAEKAATEAAAILAAAPPPADPADVDAVAQALLDEMRPLIVEEALAYLKEPGLAERVERDIADVGVAGEKDLTLLLYLQGTSRLLRKPLSVRVKGGTSSGKSYLIERVAELFPPETKVVATSFTTNSLYYLGEDALRHRWVIAGERSRVEDDNAAAEVSRAFREMQSAGRLVKAVPVKTDVGVETVLLVREGPIAFVESTTLLEVFDEDENRAISVFTDESREQTGAVLRRTAKAKAGAPDVAIARLVELHHALQRTLRRKQVVIPFAETLADRWADEALNRVESRRAYSHLLSAVEASTLLHQMQRSADADGNLIAEREDYELARRLLSGGLARLLADQADAASVTFRVNLGEAVTKGAVTPTFTAAQVAAAMKLGRRSVQRWLKALKTAGAVLEVSEARGSVAAVYQLEKGWQKTDPRILPDPDVVFAPPPSSDVSHCRGKGGKNAKRSCKKTCG